jgi:hypothetical protein
MNYLIQDLPALLTYEIGDDINGRRVRIAMHRLGITPKKDEISAWKYKELLKYFEDRRIVPTYQALNAIEGVGIDVAQRILTKPVQWIIALRHGQVVMNVRELNLLKEHIKTYTLHRQ